MYKKKIMNFVLSSCLDSRAAYLPQVSMHVSSSSYDMYPHMRRRIHASGLPAGVLVSCHLRRWIHVIWGGGYMSYEEEDTCHMRRRIHVIRCIVSSPRRSCSLSQT
jgi:hypothetical protein